MKSNLTVIQRSHILITIEDEQSACLVIVIVILGLINIVELLKMYGHLTVVWLGLICLSQLYAKYSQSYINKPDI